MTDRVLSALGALLLGAWLALLIEPSVGSPVKRLGFRLGVAWVEYRRERRAKRNRHDEEINHG